MPSCFVCNRTFSAKTKSLGISFHQIPKNEDKRKHWLSFFENCDINIMNIKEKSIVCSEHFTIDSFNQYNSRKFLKDNAIPSIWVDRMKSAKIYTPEVRFTLVVNTTVIDGVQPIEQSSSDESPVMDQDLSTILLIKPVRSREIHFENEVTMCKVDTPKKTGMSQGAG